MKLPNILTLSRIIILPIFLFFFLNPQVSYNLHIAVVLFIVSALTDLLDGKIARKYNLESDLGRILDPLADKLTLVAVFIALYYKGLINIVFLIIVLLREVVILSGAIYIFFNKESEFIKAGLVGKGATFLLYITASLYIINEVIVIDISLNFIKVVMLIAVILTVVSGAGYFIKAWKYFLEDEKASG